MMRHWVGNEYTILVCGRTGLACADLDCGCGGPVPVDVVPVERVRELEAARDRQVEQIVRLRAQLQEGDAA